MSYTRIKINTINKKFMTVVTLMVALMLISAGAISAHASFNDKGTSVTTGTAGTLAFTVTKDSSQTFFYNSPASLLPNQTRTFSTTIKNTGNVPLKYFVINQDAISGSNLTSQLTAEVKVGTTSLYKGIIGQMSTATKIRTLAVGASEVVSFTVTWPYVANVNSQYQYTSMFSAITFHAIQV